MTCRTAYQLQQNIAAAKEALADASGGITKVVIDGNTVDLSADQAHKQILYWERELLKLQGRKPAVSSYNMWSMW